MEEKRKLERFDLKVPAKVEDIRKSRKTSPLQVMTSDICSGGAFFHTEQTLPEGTKVRVDLVLPLKKLRRLAAEYDHAHIQVTGTVVRIEPRGMAVCFNRDYTIRPREGKELVRHIQAC